MLLLLLSLLLLLLFFAWSADVASVVVAVVVAKLLEAQAAVGTAFPAPYAVGFVVAAEPPTVSGCRAWALPSLISPSSSETLPDATAASAAAAAAASAAAALLGGGAAFLLPGHASTCVPRHQMTSGRDGGFQQQRAAFSSCISTR